MRKKLLSLLIIIWLSSLVLAIYLFAANFQTNSDHSYVVFCDVGQGDAILVIDGSTQILIDSGRNEQILDCLERYLPIWDREIELAIVSHADSDHIGGFETVLNRYFIKELIVSEYGSTTNVFKRFRQAVLREIESGMKLTVPTTNLNQIVGQKWSVYNFVSRVEGVDENPFITEITETLLWDRITEQNQAIKKQGFNLNALSIVTFLQLGEVKFLLTGDLDVAREQALIERGLITDVDVLKVGHHGSKTSTSDQFLTASSPEIAVISVGYNNSYGLPSPQVVDRISQFGAKILRTDELGDVVIVTDGQDYWIKDKPSWGEWGF